MTATGRNFSRKFLKFGMVVGKGYRSGIIIQIFDLGFTFLVMMSQSWTWKSVSLLGIIR